MATRRLSIRLSVEDHEAVRRAMLSLGADGQRALQRIERAATPASKSLLSINSTVQTLKNSLFGFGGGLAAIFGVRELVQYADTWTLIQNRIKLVTDSTGELNRVQEEVFRLAQDTRSEMMSTVELYTRLARSTKQLKLADEQLLTITRAVNQAIIVSGATSQEASAGVIQFSQGLASGTLRGEELRSVLEQLPRLGQAIATGMGIPFGQLQELGKQGALGSKQITDALLKQASTIQREFDLTQGTVGQAITKLDNAFGRLVSMMEKRTGAINAAARGIGAAAALLESAPSLPGEIISAGRDFAATGFTNPQSGLLVPRDLTEAEKKIHQKFSPGGVMTFRAPMPTLTGESAAGSDLSFLESMEQAQASMDRRQRRSDLRKAAFGSIGFTQLGDQPKKLDDLDLDLGWAAADIELMTRQRRLEANAILDQTERMRELLKMQHEEERVRLRVTGATEDQILQLGRLQEKEITQVQHRQAVLKILRQAQTDISRAAFQSERDADRARAKWMAAMDDMERKAMLSGDRTGANIAVGVKQALAANEQADLVLPFRESGSNVGTQFRFAFQFALTEGLRTLVEDRDFQSASEAVGQGMVNAGIGIVSSELAKKSTDLLTDWASLGADSAAEFGGTFAQRVRSFFLGTTSEQFFGEDSQFLRVMKPPASIIKRAGDQVGHDFGEGVQAGLTTFLAGKTLQMMGLNVPDQILIPVSLTSGILGELAEGSPAWTGVRDSFDSALKAGAIAAGVGRIIGDDITAQKAAIGAAIGSVVGGAIAGPLGSQIGGGLGGVFGTFVDVITGDAEQRKEKAAAVQNLLTDLSAFGGPAGFVEKIGGPSGFTGDRLQDFQEFGAVRNVFTNQLRTGLGLSKQEADDVLSALMSSGQPFNPGNRTPDQIRASIAVSGLDIPVSFQGGFAAVGVSAGNIERVKAPLGTPRVEPPPNPGSNPELTFMASDLAIMLRQNRVSESLMRNIGEGHIGEVLRMLSGQGVPHTTGTVRYLLADMARGSLSSGNRGLMDLMGIDIVAGRGANFTARKPLTMLVGDRGPEDVSVVPSNMRGAGSRQSGGNLEVHYHIGNISTLDARSMRQVVTTELVPLTIAEIKRASANGQPILHTTGLIKR